MESFETEPSFQTAAFQTETAVAARIILTQVQQLFERFSCASAAAASAARLEFFKETMWPRMQEMGSDGQLIFIPHYFDFVR